MKYDFSSCLPRPKGCNQKNLPAPFRDFRVKTGGFLKCVKVELNMCKNSLIQNVKVKMNYVP